MSTSSFGNRRAGAVLMIVMACLAIAMTLVVGWARTAVLENRQARAAEDHLQAEWLAESALERAAAQLLVNRDYAGETWQVTAADLGRQPHTDPAVSTFPVVGVVVITVESVPDHVEARRVRIQADYPSARGAAGGAGVATNRVSKQADFDLPAPGGKEVPAEAGPAEGDKATTN